MAGETVTMYTNSFEYSREGQRTVITQKHATDMGMHTNDFPMDRISGLTTLKNCITL